MSSTSGAEYSYWKQQGAFQTGRKLDTSNLESCFEEKLRDKLVLQYGDASLRDGSQAKFDYEGGGCWTALNAAGDEWTCDDAHAASALLLGEHTTSALLGAQTASSPASGTSEHKKHRAPRPMKRDL